jgi:hypothetical protein
MNFYINYTYHLRVETEALPLTSYLKENRINGMKGSTISRMQYNLICFYFTLIVSYKYFAGYSETQLIRNNWENEPSGYAKNPDNWIF